jgi:hypothetical protein
VRESCGTNAAQLSCHVSLIHCRLVQSVTCGTKPYTRFRMLCRFELSCLPTPISLFTISTAGCYQYVMVIQDDHCKVLPTDLPRGNSFPATLVCTPTVVLDIALTFVWLVHSVSRHDESCALAYHMAHQYQWVVDQTKCRGYACVIRVL